MKNPPRQTPATSLRDVSRQFCDHLRRRLLSKWTVYARSRQLHRFLRFCETHEKTSPADLTKELLQAYQQHLCEHRTQTNQPLKAGTVQHLLVGVNVFLAWLARERIIAVNPFPSIEMPRQEHRLPRAVLSAAEVETILAVPDISTTRGLRDRAMLEMFYSTGIRRMELCRLNLAHVDTAQRLVRVEQGKGKKDRLIPVGEATLQWVTRYLTDSRPEFKPASDEQALFLNHFGQRLSEQVLGSTVRKLVRRANLGKSGACHLFRHAFATGLLRNGCDLRHIQAMLGHASLETTQLYTHLDTGQLQSAHRRFHPGHQASTSSPGQSMRETLLREAGSLDDGQLAKAVDYIRLLRMAARSEGHADTARQFAVGPPAVSTVLLAH